MRSLDGNAVRTQRTRQRILDESLRLFNERGEGNVTTGMVAEALGISPGNLYYHFPNKGEIVARLFARFEERMAIDPPAGEDAAGAIEDLWLYLHLMLEAIWEFRFLYRNLDDLTSRSPRLRASFNRIAERKLAAVTSLCVRLADARAMRATPEEIRALARNVLVVATYWLNFQSLRRRQGGADADLGQAAYQVMALVAPYLVGPARRHLDRLSRSYIEN